MAKNSGRAVSIIGLKDFLKKVGKLADGSAVKREVTDWLDASGMQFLEEVQNEIIRLQVVDYRRLLNSFDKGGDGNVWRVNRGGLFLEIGTNVEYARYVNDGHFTIDPSKGLDRRWVPGRWSGDRFIYDKNAKTGMLLKFQWIDEQPYWDNAVAIFKEMFGQSFNRKLQDWVDRMNRGEMP